MASRDLVHNISVSNTLPFAVSTSATNAGNAVDTQGFESVTLVFTSGTYTTGTFTPVLEECATSGGTYTTVANANIIGGANFVAVTAANNVQALGYIGSLRYVRVSCAGASTPNALIGANAVLSHARHR